MKVQEGVIGGKYFIAKWNALIKIAQCIRK